MFSSFDKFKYILKHPFWFIGVKERKKQQNIYGLFKDLYKKNSNLSWFDNEDDSLYFVGLTNKLGSSIGEYRISIEEAIFSYGRYGIFIIGDTPIDDPLIILDSIQKTKLTMDLHMFYLYIKKMNRERIKLIEKQRKEEKEKKKREEEESKYSEEEKKDHKLFLKSIEDGTTLKYFGKESQ